MSRLPAALTFGHFLLVLGGAERIGRGGRRGVGGIGVEACLQIGEPRLQLGNASVPLSATRAWQHVHMAMLENRSPISCASFQKMMNGYKKPKAVHRVSCKRLHDRKESERLSARV